MQGGWGREDKDEARACAAMDPSFYPFASVGAPELGATAMQRRRREHASSTSLSGSTDIFGVDHRTSSGQHYGGDDSALSHADIISAASVHYKRQIDRQFMTAPAGERRRRTAAAGGGGGDDRLPVSCASLLFSRRDVVHADVCVRVCVCVCVCVCLCVRVCVCRRRSFCSVTDSSRWKVRATGAALYFSGCFAPLFEFIRFMLLVSTRRLRQRQRDNGGGKRRASGPDRRWLPRAH